VIEASRRCPPIFLGHAGFDFENPPDRWARHHPIKMGGEAGKSRPSGRPGDQISFATNVNSPSATWYTVGEVQNDPSIVLTKNYAGTSVSAGRLYAPPVRRFSGCSRRCRDRLAS